MTITCEAPKTVQIVGYETECKCEHCGRKLKHGIKISDGRTVGATCLDQKMTKAKEYEGKKYRVGASWIVNAAKIIERRNPDRWYDMGVSEHGRTFELVDA